MDKVLTYEVKEEDMADTAGGVVSLLLKNHLHVTGHEISRAKFAPGGITASGRPIRVSERAKVGDVIRVTLPETQDGTRILPEDAPIDILYEDEDLIALNKRAGEVVHPSPGHYTGTLANFVAGYFQKEGIATAPRITGRLDKETSGVILFAKNRAAAARLIRERNKNESGRTYFALVEGTFPAGKKEGTLTGNMEKAPDVLMLRRMTKEGGVPATTRYRVLEETERTWDDGTGRKIPGASLLVVTIDTGRTHQIRLHMASVGHPIVHDTLYGFGAVQEGHVVSMPDGTRRALLHAGIMTFTQPFTGRRLSLHAPLPEDFAAVLTMAGLPIPNM